MRQSTIQRQLVLMTAASWILVTGCISTPQSPSSRQPQRYTWARQKRITVHDSLRRAAYPSITRTRDGSLLVMFTRQSQSQEEEGRGELVLSRSINQGQSWIAPEVVYRGRVGEPRAMGTMTTLRSGRIIAPFAELSDGGLENHVRMLHANSRSDQWRIEEISVQSPFVWWVPCGRIIETLQGTLVMPIYGATSHANLRATIHGCALLRSTDGGSTWGDWSWIVQGHKPVVGAVRTTRFSFEAPSVVVIRSPAGRRDWVAAVSARRLNKTGDGPSPINEGPGSPQIICRLWSSDEGRTWTEPDQLAPGAWPSLATVGSDTMCANVQWAAWGEMRMLVSRNGLRSFFQEARITIRGWLRGMGNRPRETPPPPTVPYLAKDWPFERYGSSCVLPLDQDHVVVVIGRPQRGEGQIEGKENQSIPYEQEKISAVFYRRTKLTGDLAAPMAESLSPQGRWVLAERMVVDDFGASSQAANGDIIGKIRGKIRRSGDGGQTWEEIPGAELPDHRLQGFFVLSSGRWLAATGQVNEQWKGGTHQMMGRIGGYPTFKLSGESYDQSIVVHHSDDEGKTWHSSKPIKGPFLWVSPSGHFIESPDGVVSFPIMGCVTEEEMSSYSASNGVIRSHDGGETWADFSFVFRTQPPGPDDYQPEPRYSEMAIVQLANGHWVALSRKERITMGPDGWGANDAAISTDFGRTWKKTGGSLSGVSQQKSLALPDGGIAFTYRSHSWQQPGVAISYDEGRSFAYMLSGPYETINAFVHGNEFVVFTKKSHRSDMSAGVYRWVEP